MRFSPEIEEPWPEEAVGHPTPPLFQFEMEVIMGRN